MISTAGGMVDAFPCNLTPRGGSHPVVGATKNGNGHFKPCADLRCYPVATYSGLLYILVDLRLPGRGFVMSWEKLVCCVA
jgi:hypothetical protein